MAGKPRAIAANELRALAESADGIRNSNAYLIENPDSSAKEPYLVVDEARLKELQATYPDLEPLLELCTDDEEKGKKRKALTLRSDQTLVFSGKVKDINDADAIFRSISAIEKFVLPYYAGMRTLDDCKTMRGNFATKLDQVAIIHLPSSVEEGASVAGNLLVATQVTDTEAKLELLI